MPIRRNALVAAVIWGLAAICLLPVIFHWRAPAPVIQPGSVLAILLSFAVIAIFGAGIFLLERRRLDRSSLVLLVVLLISLTAAVNNLHRVNVDNATNYFSYPNVVWQRQLHEAVIESSPAVIPHSYRPLPNGIVRWIELAGIPFEAARDLYRLIFGLALFYCLYKYARMYCSFAGAVIALLLVGAIYPISFEHYAGQLTDPVAHLSFVAALALVESDEFILFASTLLVGAFAKETVLVMAVYFIIFRRNAGSYWVKVLILVTGSAAAYMVPRWLVLGGTMGYAQISGVTLQHMVENAGNWVWPAILVLMMGGLFVLLAFGWRSTPVPLKRQAMYLFPTLFLSSAFFSWLWEGRNFMPLVMVLAVAAGRYAELCFPGKAAMAAAAIVEPLVEVQVPRASGRTAADRVWVPTALRSWFLTYAVVPLLIGGLWMTGKYGEKLAGETHQTISLSGTDPELGYIDSAGLIDGNSILYVRGWAVERTTSSPVTRVTISIDGVPEGDAQLGRVRADVARFYRKPEYTSSGWEFREPVSRLQPGTHMVTVTAIGVSGSTSLSGSRTITVDAK